MSPDDEPELPAPDSRTALADHRRHDHRRTWRRRLLWIGALVLVAVVGINVAGYAHLNGNITRLDISSALGTARPTPTVTGVKDQRPLNILLMGSDDRLGLDSTAYGQDTVEGGAHSDTNLLVHLSADRTWAMVVSIPRDSMVKSPANCKDPASSVTDGVVRQWNHNYTDGGPACVIRTLEGDTGVFVDHFVVVNFNGFRDMVNALGGVEVCLSKDVVDKDSQFRLSAGRHVVDGTTALGYVRVRHALGDGSDLGRIKRQQAFLSSVIQKVTKSSMLLRPDRLYGFLDAATKSITTDQGMTAGVMKDLATSIGGIGLDKITFYTVPTEPYEPDLNRVQWTSQAGQLWSAIKSDRPIGTKATSTATATVPPGSLTVTPDKIRVEVVNDSGVGGLAVQAQQALGVQGFASVTTADGASGVQRGAVVRYGSGHEAAARTVQAAFPGATLVPDATLGSTVVVHLGLDSPFVVAVPNRLGSEPIPSPSVTPSEATGSVLTGRAASGDICQ